MSSDKEIIEGLGGAAKVAELLGLEKHGGTQRVHNWTVRGIPPKVKIDHPHLFLREQLGLPAQLEESQPQ